MSDPIGDAYRARIAESMRTAPWNPDRPKRERASSDRTEHDQIGRACMQLVDVLRAQGAPILMWSQQTERASWRGEGLAPIKRPHGIPGQADYVGCAYGVALAWEVKSRGATLSRSEREWRDAWLRAGGVFEIIRSVDEAKASLDRARGANR